MNEQQKTVLKLHCDKWSPYNYWCAYNKFRNGYGLDLYYCPFL